MRIGQKYGKLPDEVMVWMGFPEHLAKQNTIWQYIAVMDVMQADNEVEQFRQEKARQKAKAGRIKRKR